MKTGIRNLTVEVAVFAAGAVILACATPRLHAQQPDQQNQTDQQKSSDQQNQDQSQSDQQQKKKKGGIFGGLKPMTSQSSEQTKETASMGTKGALDGKQIANITPTAADKAAVSEMEKYSVAPNDLKKFQDDGKLQPKQ